MEQVPFWTTPKTEPQFQDNDTQAYAGGVSSENNEMIHGLPHFIRSWGPTIWPGAYYNNRGTFARAVTGLRKQTCVLGVRKGNEFRFRTPKNPEQIGKIARKPEQSHVHQVSASLSFRRP